jgi:protein-disulfide isomerase
MACLAALRRVVNQFGGRPDHEEVRDMKPRQARRVLPLAVFLLAGTGACTSNEDIKQIQESQRLILAKLTDLEKKVEQGAARPVAPQRPPIDPNKVYDIPLGNAPVKGPANAPVTLVEFSDFQCPFCAQVPPIVEEVLKAYPKDVKFVYKQFPLISIHPMAMGAARAAVAAQKQGKFWEMHDKLFANQRQLQPDKLKEYAQQIGLNVEQFEKDMNAPETQKQIEDDMKLAGQVQVNGTPSLFLNGKRVMNRSADGIKQMVADALTPPQKAG